MTTKRLTNRNIRWKTSCITIIASNLFLAGQIDSKTWKIKINFAYFIDRFTVDFVGRGLRASRAAKVHVLYISQTLPKIQLNFRKITKSHLPRSSRWKADVLVYKKKKVIFEENQLLRVNWPINCPLFLSIKFLYFTAQSQTKQVRIARESIFSRFLFLAKLLIRNYCGQSGQTRRNVTQLPILTFIISKLVFCDLRKLRLPDLETSIFLKFAFWTTVSVWEERRVEEVVKRAVYPAAQWKRLAAGAGAGFHKWKITLLAL